MTSNCSEDFYSQIGYDKMLENYQNTLSRFVGKTITFICGDTLQVNNYDKYQWTIFNPEAKKERHGKVFPEDMKKVYELGVKIVREPWN